MTATSSTAERSAGVDLPPGRAPIAPYTEVRAGGRVVARARADVQSGPDGATIHIHVDCEAGHQPPWARRLLVHDLLNRAEQAGIRRVALVMPQGSVEILDAVHERCPIVTARAAGSTCMIEAELRPS